MRLPYFEYLAPRTLEEACFLLAQHKEEAYPLAGGTDLLVKMKWYWLIYHMAMNKVDVLIPETERVLDIKHYKTPAL